MSSVVHPVGGKPARVYWVRRGLVLLVAAVVLGGLGLGLVRLVGALDGGSSGASAPLPSTSITSTANGPAACGSADLQLSFASTGSGYAAGANPEFTLTVVNGGSRSCTFDASAANREVVITSGSDRIWSSKDCQAKAVEDLLLLGAGASSSEKVSWERTRSAAGCPAGLTGPRPGTYKATATVAGTTLPAVVFSLG